MKRLTQYLSALILLSALAVVYQNTLVPLIQPPVAESIPIKPAQSLRMDASLTDLFPEGSWQRGSCKVLQTADGMLLFEKWEQTSSDQWKLWPVAVVMGRGMSSKKSSEPLILEANQGAEIKFSASLDVMSGGAPPIERGRMIGPVHLYRKASEGVPGKSNSEEAGRTIDLLTSNVGIDKRKIWTTDSITMQVGGARLVGSDLTIHFARDPSKGGGDAHSIMDRMELFYLDELTLPLSQAQSVDPSSPDKGIVSIGCKGRIEYDFALDHLKLSDSVSLVHQSSTGLVDRFDCDRLQLWLNDPANQSLVRSGPLDWVNKLIAVGKSEENRPAMAVLPSFDTSITADEIMLDSRAGKVRASGQKGIWLSRGPIWAGLAGLDYDFDPTRPQSIGTLSVLGAGVVKIDDPKIAVKQAHWNNSLQVRPRGMPTIDNLDVDIDINVEGDFEAEFVDGGTFKADSLHAILTPEKVQPAPGAVNLNSSGQAETTLVPSEFNVTGNVEVDTSAIIAKTDFLRLLFVSEADPVQKTLGREEAKPSPLRQWVSQPTPESMSQADSQSGGAMEVPAARARPVMRGDSIQAVLRRNTAGLSAKSLRVEGNVQVDHSLATADAMMPVRLSADRLRLLDGAGDDVLELTSSPEQPARFDIGDGFFIGRTIQVRPTENMIWIPESGEFQIPTQVLPTGMANSDPTQAENTANDIRWSRPPYCRWQGEMTFDGKSILLSDGVDITATMIRAREQWDFNIKGDRLKVNLADGVSLSDFVSLKNAEIQSIAIQQSDARPVLVKAMQRAADGALEAKHLIQAAELTMLPGQADVTAPQSGTLIGSGPGWYRGWMPSRKPTTSGPLRSDATATMIDDADRPLTGIHLTFNNAMEADMQNRRLTFGRGVRIGIKPVSHWDDAFSAAEMNTLAIGESTMDCEQLQLAMEPAAPTSYGRPGAPMPWQVQAISGIILRTRSERGLLETTANRASYAASKDLFTLYGTPNRPAVIKQFTPAGQLRINMAVKSAVVRPSTMMIESMEMESVNMATPANLSRPKPGSYR
ncbi:hypothetical protein LF1_10680 [Rubripirellula obstinata]|uniref:Uncharacterized protein n=1 Tax=Rubripirellula obstinata TaxID=406547 RepID=A0A5B1CBK0_9BACT|nr:hypothetical protein [Rubripirellula obstinata]KAA1258548.1 hypothetical protein LF1_10680 [Rubripirellula obstinata]